MNQEHTGPEFPPSERMPQRISEGMIVHDAAGESIGTVQVVYFGGASEEAIARVFRPESGESDLSNLPEELVTHLMSHGYMIVEGPDLAGAKRYIRPEQIEGVFPVEIAGTVTDIVRLRVTRNELTQ
ncbi:MAG TPA: hypothetical protein VFQ23_25745 [Anaerolineales bacterium]|nr:hypothetical protein [Anaerolineales bacterium]